MTMAARKDGLLTAGLVSSGVTAVGAVVIGFFLIVSVGGGPELLVALATIATAVPVAYLCLSLLQGVRDAEVTPWEAAPKGWQGWSVFLLGLAVWLTVNGFVLWVVLEGPTPGAAMALSGGELAVAAVFLLVPLPALIALGNFCLLGRPVPPGGHIDDATG